MWNWTAILINNKNFYFEQNKDSDKLAVIFSGVNSKDFMGYKLIKEIKCNKIFIREDKKSWYHSKIDGVSNNIDELIQYIKTYTDKFKSKDITFIGSSMGGYASLLIGIKLHVKRIIAFGPQIIINKNFPNNPKDDSYIKYKNLTSLINQSNSNIDIIIGMNELADLYHIKDINNSHVKIFKLFAQPHNVMYYLQEIGILKEYISSNILGKEYNLNILNTYNYNLDNNYLKKAVDLFYIKKEYYSAEKYFNNLIDIYPSINTFYKYKGICNLFNNNYKEAINQFKQSEYLVFRDNELHYYLGLCFFNLKDFFNASNHFKHALEFATTKKLSYYIKLAVSYRELKKYNESLEILQESLQISTKNYGTYYQLAQIYKLLKKNDLAIQNLKTAINLKPNNKSIIAELQKLSK